jgi:uncharacterized protein YndB with AHSA1/START domain
MIRILAMMGILVATAGPTSAAVIDVAVSGFAVKNEAMVNATPDTVYAAVLHDIGRWWNGKHSYSGDSTNLSIDARPDGCFCEKLPGGGGVEHAKIIALIPGSLIRMSGALGPLQASGLTGTLTLKFIPADGGAKVEMTYSVGGYMEGGLQPVAAPVDGVLRDQLERLKAYVESHKTP